MKRKTMSSLRKMFVPFCLIMTSATSLRYDCSKTEYQRCIQLADPLIKEVQFIFPDNINDIDLVCRTWNNFVDCLKSYTETCFSEVQRHQFNKAVEMPIASVHQMCTQTRYQKEYLRYAPCMKSTVMPGGHCGLHYNLLVDQVNQGEIISKATLCCSHIRFKQCVVEQVGEMCDGGVDNGPAVTFSTQIIDKALSFLRDQCFNYIPNSGDCANAIAARAENYPLHTEVIPISTVPNRETYQRWGPRESTLAKKDFPTATPTVTTWLPSSVPELSTEVTTPSLSSRPVYNTLETTPSVDLGLGSRSRPASYGRSRAWSSYGARNPEPVVSISPKLEEPKTSGATISSWTVVNHPPPTGYETSSNEYRNEQSSSSTTWYPAAGSQLSNEVDEPNQMGLVKPDNSSQAIKSGYVALVIACIFWKLTRF